MRHNNEEATLFFFIHVLTIDAPFSGEAFSDMNKITLLAIVLGSLSLLISSLSGAKGLRKLENRILALGGLLGLLFAACDVYWHFHIRLRFAIADVGYMQYRLAAILFYSVWHLLGGASIGILLFVVSPKGANVMLRISLASIVVVNVVLIAYYHTHHIGSATRLFLLWNALFLGIAISSVILARRRRALIAEPGTNA